MRRHFVIILISTILLALGISWWVYSQSSHWRFVGWYGGGNYPNIEFDHNVKDRLYLVSDVAGIWRSDDLGKHWRFINKGLLNIQGIGIITAPSDPRVLYAATERGFFFSDDAGAVWQSRDGGKGFSFQRSISYRPIAVGLQDADHVCAGTSQGKIFCSDNAGLNWQDVPVDERYFLPGSPVTALAFISSEDILYAASSRGVFRYSFSQKRWTPSLEGHNVSELDISKNGQRICVAGEDQLWVSRDGGGTWGSTSPVPRGKVSRVAVSGYGNNEKIFVSWVKGWRSGILMSQDNGVSWQAADTVLNPDYKRNPTRSWAWLKGRINAIKVNPFDDRNLFFTDSWGVWRSDDRGKSWGEQVNGAPNSVGTDLVFSTDKELYAASMDQGLLKSTDGGRFYTAVFPSQGQDAEKMGHIWRVRLLGQDRIIGTFSPWEKSVNQIILSKDAGKTFQVIQSGLPESRPEVNALWGQGYPRALAVDPRDNNHLFLGIDGDDGGGLFISRDGGETWKRSLGSPGSLRIFNGLVVDPEDHKRIYWATCEKEKGGIYASSDEGESWSRVFDGTTCVFDMATDGGSTIYATGSSSGAVVFASKDQGQTWIKTGDFPEYDAVKAIAVSPKNSRHIAVSTISWSGKAPQAVFFSRDGGKTWRDVTGNLPVGTGAYVVTFDPTGSSLYISCHGPGLYRLAI